LESSKKADEAKLEAGWDYSGCAVVKKCCGDIRWQDFYG